jgi:hypothetical protein
MDAASDSAPSFIEQDVSAPDSTVLEVPSQALDALSTEIPLSTAAEQVEPAIVQSPQKILGPFVLDPQQTWLVGSFFVALLGVLRMSAFGSLSSSPYLPHAR